MVADIDPLAAPPGATPHTEGDFYFQNEWAWIDYDPISMTMNVYLSSTSTKQLVPDLSNTVDVFGALGGSPAFVGFSAPEPPPKAFSGLAWRPWD